MLFTDLLERAHLGSTLVRPLLCIFKDSPQFPPFSPFPSSSTSPSSHADRCLHRSKCMTYLLLSAVPLAQSLLQLRWQTGFLVRTLLTTGHISKWILLFEPWIHNLNDGCNAYLVCCVCFVFALLYFAVLHLGFAVVDLGAQLCSSGYPWTYYIA